VFAHMTETSGKLQSLSTNLEYTKVTVLVNDRDVATGKLYYQRGNPPSMLINFTVPEPKTVLVRNNQAEIYLPKIKQIQRYSLQKHSELVQQFLLLGFGTYPADLEKAYSVKVTGEEAIKGRNAVVLELTPKNEKVAAQLVKVQLWLSEESWLPLQQKFYEPGGDYLETDYSDEKINPPLKSSVFSIKAPDAKVVTME